MLAGLGEIQQRPRRGVAVLIAGRQPEQGRRVERQFHRRRHCLLARRPAQHEPADPQRARPVGKRTPNDLRQGRPPDLAPTAPADIRHRGPGHPEVPLHHGNASCIAKLASDVPEAKGLTGQRPHHRKHTRGSPPPQRDRRTVSDLPSAKVGRWRLCGGPVSHGYLRGQPHSGIRCPGVDARSGPGRAAVLNAPGFRETPRTRQPPQPPAGNSQKLRAPRQVQKIAIRRPGHFASPRCSSRTEASGASDMEQRAQLRPALRAEYPMPSKGCFR